MRERQKPYYFVEEDRSPDWEKKIIVGFTVLLFVFLVLKLLGDVVSRSMGMSSRDFFIEAGLSGLYIVGFLAIFISLAFIRLPAQIKFVIFVASLIITVALIIGQWSVSSELAPAKGMFKAAVAGCKVTGRDGHELKCDERLQKALRVRDEMLREMGARRIGDWKIDAIGATPDSFVATVSSAYFNLPFLPPE